VNLWPSRISLLALPVVAALLHLSTVAVSSAQTPVQLAGVGTGEFTLETSATTAKVTQSAAGLAFSSLALGDTLGGLFPALQNWARSDYTTFGVIMSIEGANPGLPFDVEVYDSSLSMAAKYEGTTIGVGSMPVFVPLEASPGHIQSLGDVKGVQWTWNGAAPIKVTVRSFAVVSSLPADVSAPVLASLPAKRYTKAGEFVLRVSAEDNRGLTAMTGRITRPDGAVSVIAKDLAHGPTSVVWSPKLQLDQEGSWRVEVQARDAAGNSSTRTMVLVADRSVPSARRISPPTAITNNYRLRVSLSDAFSYPELVRYRLRPPNGAFSAWSQQTKLNGTKPTKEWFVDLNMRKRGPWRVALEVRDKAGNVRVQNFNLNR
jgi:hypothetical protein